MPCFHIKQRYRCKRKRSEGQCVSILELAYFALYASLVYNLYHIL